MAATSPPGSILIVEDDRKTASLVATYLEREGFRTISSHDGGEVLDLVRRHAPAFIILDLMLPNADGRDVCRQLRQASDIPILILTARDEEVDCVVGFSLGADDYVVKPFSPRELVARVKAILRRARSDLPKAKGPIAHGGLVLDLDKRIVTLHGRRVALTVSEFTLLQALMRAPGRVFLRDELLDHLYPGGEAVIDRVIDVHIGKLRQKIELDPSKPRFIMTVRGVGYQFADGEYVSE